MRVAVVLAAGASSRMGRPKALLVLGESTLIEHHIEVLLSVCAEVVVVVGAHESEIRSACTRPCVRVVENKNWANSDALASLKIGVREFSEAEGVVVTPVDAPPVSPADLLELVNGETPRVLSWEGAHGHPVFIGRAELRSILNEQVSGGLRSLLTGARSVPASSPDILLNLNTPESWRSYLAGVPDKK